MVPHVNPFKRSRDYIPLQTFDDSRDSHGLDGSGVEDGGGGGDAGSRTSEDGDSLSKQSNGGVKDTGNGDVTLVAETTVGYDRSKNTQFSHNGTIVQGGAMSNGHAAGNEDPDSANDGQPLHVRVEGRVRQFQMVGLAFF